MLILYATDLHGNREAIEQAFKIATEKKVDAVVFGGDLTPSKIAIKLPYCPDFELGEEEFEKIKKVGGEILPVDALQLKGEANTYTESLETAKRVSDTLGSEEFTQRLKQQGWIIYEITNAFYELNSLLAEQTLIDKLYNFVRDSQDSRREKPTLKLSEDEMLIAQDSLSDWGQQLEESWETKKRDDLVRKCRLAFTTKEGDFDHWRPSRYLADFILYKIGKIQILRFIQEIEGLLKKLPEFVRDYFRQAFESAHQRLLQANLYDTILERSYIAALSRYSTIAQLINQTKEIKYIGQQQAKFLGEYFLPLVQQWRQTNSQKPVYAMLANDDIIENLEVLKEAEQAGVLFCLNETVHSLSDDLFIVGYGFVTEIGEEQYSAWLKKEEEALRELCLLAEKSSSKPAIWVIHHPPYGCLDQTKTGQIGSRSVEKFLKENQPSLALLGHVHEAPDTTGSCIAHLGKTVCVNPGGNHENGVRAVLIDTETLEIKEIKGGG